MGRLPAAGGLWRLTRKEFDLLALALLARRPGTVVSRERILAEVWHTTWRGAGRTLDVHVATPRAKLAVDRDGKVVVASRERLPLDDPVVQRHLRDALSGERSGIEGVVGPWQTRALVVSEPVGRGGEVIGAAVTISSTERLRRQTVRRWAVLALIGLVAPLASWLAAVRMTRWVLRPVRCCCTPRSRRSSTTWGSSCGGGTRLDLRDGTRQCAVDGVVAPRPTDPLVLDKSSRLERASQGSIG